MSSMWTCFSLVCAAIILQSSASNNVVSLTCRDTVEVVAGEDVTLNCSIIYLAGLICKGEDYQWSNSHGDIELDSDLTKYMSGWDSLSYVYLIISNVIKEEKYTVRVVTDCDSVDKSINVRVKQDKTAQKSTGITSVSPKSSEPSLKRSHVIPTILGILVTTAVIVGILCFLVRTNRGRQIISRMKDKTQGGDGSEAEMENMLIH